MKFAKPDIFILYTGQEVVKLLKELGFFKAHY
jgi:predicted RNA binding protein YcfA (HicA-like mRNA interferase family)